MKKIALILAFVSLMAAACSASTTIDTGAAAPADSNAGGNGGDSTSDSDGSQQAGSQDAGAQDDQESDTADAGSDGTETDGTQDDGREESSSDDSTSVDDDENGDATDSSSATDSAPSASADAPSSVTDDAAAREAFDTLLSTNDWCTAAAAVESQTSELGDVNFTDPEVLEVVYTRALAFINAAQRLAPPEIAGDVAIQVQGFTALTAALEDVNWSFLDLDLTVLDGLDDQMELSGYNIEKYNYDRCGIGEDPGTPPVPGESTFDTDDLPEGTIRDQAVQGLVQAGFTEAEAACLFEKLDFANPEALSDPSQLFNVFSECGISLDRMSQLGGG